MREGWKRTSLDDVCEIAYGTRVIKKRDSGTLYPVYGGGGETFRIDRFNREDCTIVSRFGMSESCVRHVPGKFFLNDSGLSVSTKSSKVLIQRLLDYFLYASQRVIYSLGRGSAQKNLDVGNFRKLEIHYPESVPEQKRIVAILDEAFAGIDAAIANTEKNLANARELFESYLNSVFSQQGDGWEVKSVGDFADHCLGKMLDKNKNKGVMKPYLRNVNVQWFQVHTDDVLEMKIEPHEEDRFSVKSGDLLICEGGYPGRAAIWEKDEVVYFQKALHRVRCNDQRLNRWLLYYLYYTDANGELEPSFTGAGIQHFTGKALNAFRVPLPPEHQISDLLSGIEAVHNELESLESIYQQKLSALVELKQSLLQKAFSGELTADKEVSSVALTEEEIA